MNIFPALAVFVTVAAIVYPLYEGTIAYVIALVIGLLAAVFVAVGKSRDLIKKAEAHQQLLEFTKQATDNTNTHFTLQQEQLVNTLTALKAQTVKNQEAQANVIDANAKVLTNQLQDHHESLQQTFKIFTTQLEKEHQQLVQSTTLASTTVIDSLQTYQSQLSMTVADLAKQTNASLMAVWNDTQQALMAENKEMKDTTSELVQQLTALQVQQKELASYTAVQLQQWLTSQQQVSQQTFEAVQQSHQQLLEDTVEKNTAIESLWQTHQAEQLAIRQQEQQAFKDMLTAVEAKEAAYRQHLEAQRDIFEAAQQQLKEALREQAQLSHNALLAAWKETDEATLALRQEEHRHVMDTQQVVTEMIDRNTTALQNRIVAGWDETRQSFEQLRATENEHATALFDTVAQANEKMQGTLTHQEETFNVAQSFYANTYDQIKLYTGQLKQHEDALAAQHQQLIDTQTAIKETIAKTLNDTLTQYTDVLTTSNAILKDSIHELKNQRAVSEESFGEFVEFMSESTEVQSETTNEMIENLTTQIDNILQSSTINFEDALKAIKRSSNDQKEQLEEILQETSSNLESMMNASNEVMQHNKQLLKALNEQTVETKNTAKLLEQAFKEVTTLNEKDMDILQRLMR